MDIDTIKQIEQSCETISELESKTNEEIAQLLVEHIWSHLGIFGPASDLLGEVIERLRGADAKKPCRQCKTWQEKE